MTPAERDTAELAGQWTAAAWLCAERAAEADARSRDPQADLLGDAVELRVTADRYRRRGAALRGWVRDIEAGRAPMARLAS